MPLTPSLSERRREPEIMDDPALAAEHHHRALRGLARLNRLSASAGILWPALRDLARELRRPIRVLDVASGAGDVPLQLHRVAQRHRVAVAIDGCDISPRAIAHAKETSRASGLPCRFFRLDALQERLPRGYDAVTCSLFLHHLDDAEVVGVLASMAAAARHLVLVSDLRRSAGGLALAYGASRLFSRSTVVRTDAVLSVRAAFTVDELRHLAGLAGLRDADVTRRRPCRMLLSWRRS